jgi:glycosyltransferase involved in cell wall biosynthesis
VNRSILTKPARLAPDGLPPERTDALRLLTITNHSLGWRTYANAVETATAEADDVDAVHVHLATSRAMELATARRLGGTGRLDPHYRRLRAWSRVLRRWRECGLDLARFDVVHVTPQFPAAALGPFGAPPRLSVGLDATQRQARQSRAGLDAEAVARAHGPMLDAEAAVIARADLVVPMSQWAADGVTSEYGVPPDRIEVVPPTIAVERRRPPGPGGEPRVAIAFVGNNWTRKGGPRLLDWHQRHFADRADLHVFSGGAKPVAGTRNVQWHGSVPHAALIGEFLPAMDVVVVPTFSDMSPWAVVEAVSVGLPVVSSALGGIGELVVDGANGFLLDPADEEGFVRAIGRLVDEPDVRARQAAAAIDRAETHLDPAVTGRRFIDRLIRLARSA